MRRLCILFLAFVLLSLMSDAYAYSPRRHDVRVEDTLAVSCRGVMETFPNMHVGVEDRMEFYKKLGYTHYFYSPSDDRYCNAWGWKFLYNDTDRHIIRGLVDKCRKKGLEFVWTVNPGEDFRWEGDLASLVNKLIIMYYNGVRTFAVDFAGTDERYSSVRDSVRTVFMNRKLKDADIFVMDDLSSVVFPSEDDAARTLMKGYHLDEAFLKSAEKHDAVICVLREKSELSCIALATVMECARNPREYDADKAMEAGIMSLSPEVKEPLMTFLEHTGGVNESKSLNTFTLSEWSSDKSAVLLEEFKKIEAVPAQMSSCSSPSLLEDLSPWMVEFGRLGARGCRTIACVDHYVKGDLGSFWISYMENQMSESDRVAYERHPVGKMKLHPFCVGVMSELTEAFTSMLGGGQKLMNLASTLYAKPNHALDSDLSTSLHSNGHVVFPVPAQANTCRLLTGRIPEGETVLFRQLATDGSLVAEFVVGSPYTEFDLKEGSVSVDVMGNVDIYETIFVYL